MTDNHDVNAGTQALDRAMTLVAELAAYAPLGVRLIDLSNAAGLTRPTTHRILQALKRVGLVVQESNGRRYKLGSLALALESAAPPKLLIEAATDSMSRITALSGQTTMLVSRQGRFGLVSAVEHGTDEAINRNPSVAKLGYASLLGTTSASIAIFSSLDDAQVEEILFANEWNVLAYGGVNYDALLDQIAEARRRGYALTTGVISGIGGLAVPVQHGRNPCFGSIAILGRSDVVNEEFAHQWAPRLQTAARAAAESLAEKRATVRRGG